MAFLIEYKALIFAVLFALSELIGALPMVKASGVLEMIVGFLKSLFAPPKA